MAGGKFVSMDKVRPGAYINFEGETDTSIRLGTRGIATMIMQLNWGAESALTEVTGTDLVDGKSLAKIGLTSDDASALLINLALQNCKSVKIFNPLSGGTRASTILGGSGGLEVTAKYPGTFGNKIAMLIKAVGSKFNVETYADGYKVDSQLVSTATELKANDFVTFTAGTLATVSSTLLTGGANGTASSSATYIQTYFNLLRTTKWNTMAHTSSDDIAAVVTFIEDMRENEGKYVQAVVSNYDSADYEGIINNINGVTLEDGTSVSALQFAAWVAGAVAGAGITESLTGKVVNGATSIVGALSNSEIIDALNVGKFVLSLNQDGSVKVEKDINSLHTFTADKGYTFSKNRVIRELDEIGSSIENIWETTYLGKVSNNDNGRTLFKSSIIDYLTDLEIRGAIQNFDSSLVEVIEGPDIDSVIANIAIKPVDSMEFLYLTVHVQR